MKKLNLILLSTFVVLLIFSSCKKEETAVVKEELTQEKILDLINGPQTTEDLKRLDEYYGLTDTKLTREELEQHLGIDDSDKITSQDHSSSHCPCNIASVEFLRGSSEWFFVNSMSNNGNNALMARVTPLSSGSSPMSGWLQLVHPNCNSTGSLLFSLQTHFGGITVTPGHRYRIDVYLGGNNNCFAHAHRYFRGR